ncbi:hypothetical protein KR093_000763, partial [Drosophila rubida]
VAMEGVDNNHLIRLLKDMTSAHPETVRKSSDELAKDFNDATSTLQLCAVLGNAKRQPELRKCAGNILKTRLADAATWQQQPKDFPAKAQVELMAALKALHVDDDEALQSLVLRNLGVVMQRSLGESAETTDWNESVFDHVEELSKSKDGQTQTLSAIIFKLLIKTSPKMFQNYLVRAQRIFMHIVAEAEAQGNLFTAATEQLLNGWSLAIPLFNKRPSKQAELSATLPPLMKLTHASAYQPDGAKAASTATCRGIDVLTKLNQLMPELVWPHLKLVMDELFLLAVDKQLSDKMRVHAISAIRSCVRTMRRHIIRLKMMDKLLMTLYGLLAVQPPLDDNDEEQYLGETDDDTATPLAEAAKTILYVAAHSDTNRVADRALRLMQPQLEQAESALQRLGALLFLSLMAKGFTDLLADNYLDRFLAAVELGVRDSEAVVRRGAHYALAIMAENLQPEITRLAARVLPLFYHFFDALSEHQRLVAADTEVYTRMFCTLEIYCESLKPEVMQPHLAELMKRMMMLVQPNTNSPALRQMCLSTIASLAKITKELFSPHFDEVMSATLPLVKHTPDEDQLLLRTHAIQVINALGTVCPEKFAKEASNLFGSCLDMIKHMAGAQVFTYELLGVLSGYIPKEINAHFSLIMGGLLTSIKEAATMEKPSDESKDDSEDEETEEDSGSVRDGHGDQTEASTRSAGDTSTESTNYLNGHDEAVMCLKAFAINMPDSLLPYLSESMQRVFTSTDHMQELDKWSAYETLTQFILLYSRQGNPSEAKKHAIQLLPAMVYFVQTAKETVNVVSVMKSIERLLLVLKSEALAADGYAEMLFEMLRRTLRRKLNCQFNIGIDLEMETLQQWSQAMHAEQQVMEAAGDLIPVFGHSLTKRQFAGYFQTLSKSFVKNLRQSMPVGPVSRSNFFMYNLMGRSMEALGVIAEQYYEVLCYCIVDCMQDQRRHIRDFASRQIDWLLTHSTEHNNADTIIAATSSVFSEALEPRSPLQQEERDVLCGILGRMVRIDSKCVTMNTLIPVLLGALPLREKFDCYIDVMPALHVVFKMRMDLLRPRLAEMLEVLLGALQSHQLPNAAVRQMTIELVKSIKLDDEALYQQLGGEKYAEAKALIV